MQPYLLPFSTTQYEDEDMYMGNNEADKLKENRICRKVTWKGKAQQEEEGSNTTTEESDDDMSGHVEQRCKGVNLNIDEDVVVIEANMVSLHIESHLNFH